MSTLKSSAEDLTLNADGSGNDIIFQSNGSNVATLDQAGLLTATTFAGSGASLTALNATNLGSGTVPTARLGTGTANSSVHLRGDGAWAAAGGGKVLQMTYGPASEPAGMSTSSTDFVVVFSHTITPSATSSKIHISAFSNGQDASATRIMKFSIYRAIDGGATTNLDGSGADNDEGFGRIDSDTTIAVPITLMYLDSPNTTSEITYSFRVRSGGGAGNVEITNGLPHNFILTEIEG